MDVDEQVRASDQAKSAPGGFDFEFADTDLVFSQAWAQDATPTGRQIVSAVNLKPADEFAVLRWLRSGRLRPVELDDSVDLRDGEANRFIISRTDREFFLEIEGDREEWPAAKINGLTIKHLGEQDPEAVAVFLECENELDQEIDDDQFVDLSGKGLEKFHFRPAEKIVEIFVNTKPVKISRGKHTGLDIKREAIRQGVAIKLDFVLSLETQPGKTKIIGDADTVKIKGGEQFIAVADDDKS